MCFFWLNICILNLTGVLQEEKCAKSHNIASKFTFNEQTPRPKFPQHLTLYIRDLVIAKTEPLLIELTFHFKFEILISSSCVNSPAHT